MDPECPQHVEGDGLDGLGEVGVAVPVGQSGAYAVEQVAARQGRVAEAEGVVADGGHEAGQGRNTVGACVQDADGTELALGDARVRV